MLRNNNLKICHKLVWRDFRFHKGKNVLTAIAIMLLCALCTFAFSLGGMVYDGYIYNFELSSGFFFHILYYDVDGSQVDALADHGLVEESVSLNAIGVLSDDVMEYRSVKLAAAKDRWAEMTESVPLQGRMPLEKNEIALDETTLNSMAIPHEIGAEVTIRWIPLDGSGERRDTFRLCGWWSSAMNFTETYAWITQEAAQELCVSLPDASMVGVTLYHPEDLDSQAEKMLNDIGLENVDFATNLAYNSARRKSAGNSAKVYYMINFIVVLCGILMIYNIVRISTEQNIHFYGRVKSLGMTPRQIRCLLVERIGLLCAAAVPLGWLLGIGIYLLFAPVVVIGMNDINPGLFFFRLWPLAVSGLIAWGAAMFAGFLPAGIVAGISPVQAMRYVDIRIARLSAARRHLRRRTGIPAMALSGLWRRKGRTLAAAASLFAALALMCSAWTRYFSYDQEKYMAGLAVADYSIADASAVISIQRYNPWSRSITPEMTQSIANHPAVTEMGLIRTMEVPMFADEEERAPIVDSFEYVDESGKARKTIMNRDPDWMEGYERFRASGEYIGIVTGIDGLAATKILTVRGSLEGVVDLELFESGRYVIAAGADASTFISTPPAGSFVTIGGRQFEIMASIPAPSSLITGGNSREAAFNVAYYLPERVFDSLFPDSGIRNVLINIDIGRQTEFELFLDELLEGSYAYATTRSEYQWNFENARFRQEMLSVMVGIVLLMIGLLNFANAIVTKTLIRKKEFAIYESLGMTRRQLRRLLAAEGLLHGAALTVLILPAVAAVVWLYTRWWLEHTNTWCITYHYSLAPLWLSVPILLAVSAAIPLCCLRFLTRENVTVRLRIDE